MKLHVAVLAISVALVGCKDKKGDTKDDPKKASPDAGAKAPKKPEPDTAPLPRAPLAATRPVEQSAFVRIGADGAVSVGAIAKTAIVDGSLVEALPAGTATDLTGLAAAIKALDGPERGVWMKQRMIEAAKQGGIIAPMPPAWPRAGDLHARAKYDDDDPWAPLLLVAPATPASRLLEVIRAGGRGAHLAVITDGDAVRALKPYVDHVIFGSGTEEASEVLVVIRPGDDAVAMFDKAIADKKRTPESGDPWVRLQAGEAVTAGELVAAIAALDRKSPLGMVIGQTGPVPPSATFEALTE